MPCACGGAGVLGVAADGEQAAVHLGMQGLEPAVHHLGKAGVLGDVLDGDAGVLSALAVPPVERISTPRGKRAGEVDEAGLVGNRDQGARRICRVGHGVASSTSRAALAWIGAKKQVGGVHAE